MIYSTIDFIIFAVIILITAFALLSVCLHYSVEDDRWEYERKPIREGRYIIRFCSGVQMEADWWGGQWHYLDGGVMPSDDIDCWRDKYGTII